MKRAPRRRGGAKRRGAKRSQAERATLKETHLFAPLTTGNAYFDYSASLRRSFRAALVGQGYREFRITKLEYRFKPSADTFPTGGTQVPYLYAMIDKTGSMRDFNTVDELVTAGAKARRLDDKTITVSFKPATLSYNRDETGNSNLWSKPIVSPWLSCDSLNDAPLPGPVGYEASSIDHLGLAWMVATSGGTQFGYTVEVVSHFEFRKPSWTILPKDPSLPPAIQAPSVHPEVIAPVIPK